MQNGKTDEKVFDILYRMMIEKQYHNAFGHGLGFCVRCGELRKRCECVGFVEPDECKCRYVEIYSEETLELLSNYTKK